MLALVGVSCPTFYSLLQGLPVLLECASSPSVLEGLIQPVPKTARLKAGSCGIRELTAPFRTEIVFCSRVDWRSGFMILVAAKFLVISRSVSTIKFVLNGLNFLGLTFKWYSRRKYSVNF